MILVSGKSFEGLKKQEFQQILGSYFYVVLSCLYQVRLGQVMNEQDWKLRESLQGAKTYVIRCHFCNFIICKNVFCFVATIPVIDDKDDYWWLLTKNMINEKKCMSTFLISKTDICLAGNFSCKGQFSLFPQIGFTLAKCFDVSSIFKGNFEIYFCFRLMVISAGL